MRRRRQLLVVGGSVVERTPGGGWVTRVPIADYLHELALYFDGCVWIAPLYEGRPLMKGAIKNELVRVVPFKNSPLYYPLQWFGLVVECMPRPYVLLYLPAAVPLLPAIPSVRQLARRMVVYLAGDYSFWFAKGRYSKLPGGEWFYRAGHEYPMKIADAVIARGKYLAGLASRFNENVIETVPIGHMRLASCSERRQATSHMRRVLFLGKVLWSKGLGDLLLALQAVVQNHPETIVMLDVVGDGTDRAEVEAQVKVLGLDEHVKFHGWIEGEEELSNFFRGSDVLVVPSSSPEGVPRVIDEALVRNVPVIATRVGGIADEFVQDEVMLVDPGDPRRLTHAIELMLFDQASRQRYLEGAQRRREVWTQCGSAARQHARILLQEKI